MKIRHLPEFTKPNLVAWLSFRRSDSIFGLDVETTAIDETAGAYGKDTRLRTVQFGNKDEAWVFDVENPSEWANYIRQFLAGADRRFVHHTAYDALWVLRHWGIDLMAEKRCIDTFVMASLLWPGPRMPHDLKTLSEKHVPDGKLMREAEQSLIARFKELAPKGQRVGEKLKAWGFTNISLTDVVFGQYAGLDAIMVRRLLNILAARLTLRRQGKLSRREQDVARLMAGVQARGHLVDQDHAREVLDEVFTAYKDAERFLIDAFGLGPTGPRSPKRGPWLEAHGVEFTKRTKTGAPQLNKFTLPGLAKRYEDDAELGPIFTNMMALSARSNLLTNMNIIVNGLDASGRVHPHVNTQQAITGRMSITGPAMQTFKKTDKRIRNCFMASEGNILVGADYDSQEVRLAAAFSQDPLLLKIVNTGLNQHDLTAESMFGSDYTGVQRHQAKTLDFAQQYGAGPRKLAETLGVTLGEARKLWEDWRKAYAGLVRWTNYMGTFDEVVNPWGRIIPADPMRRYASGNYMIQSSGRDVLGDALVKLDRAGWGANIWLPIHDEIVMEVPEHDAERACEALSEAMTCTVRGIAITTSPEVIGTYWGGK